MKIIKLLHIFSIVLAKVGPSRANHLFRRPLAADRLINFSSFHNEISQRENNDIDFNVSIPIEVTQLLKRISKYTRFKINGEKDELWQLYTNHLV